MGRRNAIRTSVRYKTQGKTPHLKCIGVCQYLAIVFEVNEQLPPERKQTDGVIKMRLLKEYGHLPGMGPLIEGKRTINYYRYAYNRGELLKVHRHRPPAVLSRRYDEQGRLANKRTGRAMDTAEIAEYERKEAEFRAMVNRVQDEREGVNGQDKS